jgi:hypothetical protein
MTAWEQEIDLIIKGDLKGATEVYHGHRPDVGIADCYRIIEDVAKTMNLALAKLSQSDAIRFMEPLQDE